MKKTGIKKLTLNRETLMPLDSNDLEHVNGGASLSASVRATIKLSKASLQNCSRVVKEGAKWVTRKMCPASVLESVMETARRTGGGGEQKP
jgi:hypothetical protein